MKKQFLYFIALAVFLMTAHTSCKKDDKGNGSGKDVQVTGITLNSEAFTLGVGNTETLIATVQPTNATNKTVTWTSSNPTVATVMPNGLVTALSKGATTIVVTTVEGSFSASCAVKVDDISVTGVTLNKTTLTLDIDETGELEATVLPENATNQEVYWLISDPAVATIFNGLVTPHKLGTATITVTTLDGNKTEKCELKVIKRVPVTGVTLNKNKFTLGVGTSEKLVATVSPYNATNKNVIWSSSDPDVATVDDEGLVTAKTAGTVIITVTTEDGDYTAECEVKCIDYSPPVLTTLEPTNVVFDGYSASATITGDITFAGNPPYTERGFVYAYCYDPLSYGPGCPYGAPTWIKVSGSGTGQFSRNFHLYFSDCPAVFFRAYLKTAIDTTYGNRVEIYNKP